VDQPLGNLENAAGEGGTESGGSSNGGSSNAGSSSGGSAAGGTGSGGSGGGACGCVESQVSWGLDGGLVAYTETSTLTPCATFLQSRDEGTGPSILCMQEITSCAGGVGPRSVAEALADPDVRAAVAAAPVLYGGDPRPVDGSVLRIEIDGDVIEVGPECGTASNCTPIPSGIAELARLLGSLTDQELARGQCGGGSGECFSPDVHPELALDANATGCSCLGTEEDVCVAVEEGVRLHLLAMVCDDDGRWHSVLDGPCEPTAGPRCLVGNRLYQNGQRAPDPFSFCNECVCSLEGLDECTGNRCAGTPCPSGTRAGSRCRSCGAADQCDIVEYGCLPSCTGDDTCPEPTLCIDGVCKFTPCG
jgi:hypothetical protein